MKAITIANYLLRLNHHKRDGYYLIDNLKLQRLLYYCQGYHLAVFDKRLFDDPIIATERGPIIKSIYNHYKAYNDKSINNSRRTSRGMDKQIDLYAQYLVMTVFEKLGPYDNWQLSSMVHEEIPFLMTEQDKEISLALMQIFFKQERKPQSVQELPDLEDYNLENYDLKTHELTLNEAFVNGLGTIYSNFGRLLGNKNILNGFAALSDSFAKLLGLKSYHK
ncbi:hypothetical protein COTS27_00907 [Spirochaetota bacterium]|nr:hypothetical protein COTS27_00907 [Spirochaetota bacterium]